MITSSQTLFFAPYSIAKHYLWLQAHEFYHFSLMLVTHYLTFLFMIFIDIMLCPISYSSHSLLRLYFPGSSSSSSKLVKNLFQVLCTRFLRPPHKGDNGWLAMAVIALLVIVWFIIIRKPSLWQESQVLWSRLWSKN